MNEFEPLRVYARYENIVDTSCMFDLVGLGGGVGFLLSVIRSILPYILFILFRAVCKVTVDGGSN
jgi:hypothetical protein